MTEGPAAADRREPTERPTAADLRFLRLMIFLLTLTVVFYVYAAHRHLAFIDERLTNIELSK